MLGDDSVCGVRAESTGSGSHGSKRRRRMPTCFGGETPLNKRSLKSTDHERSSANASAAPADVNHNKQPTRVRGIHRLVYRHCSTRRSKRVRMCDSNTVSVTTVSRCQSVMSMSAEQEARDRHVAVTSSADSGYSSHLLAPAPFSRHALSRGCLSACIIVLALLNVLSSQNAKMTVSVSREVREVYTDENTSS